MLGVWRVEIEVLGLCMMGWGKRGYDKRDRERKRMIFCVLVILLRFFNSLWFKNVLSYIMVVNLKV